MKILIVEDDTSSRKLLKKAIETRLGYEIIEATNGKEALCLLESDKEQSITLVLMDLSMPEMGGKETLEKIREIIPSLPVIIITASEELDDAIEVMQLGANDFLVKPIEPERLCISINNALRINELSEEVSRLSRKDKGHVLFEDLIGFNSGLTECIKLGGKAAKSDIPVLIYGESGVGKELLARSIHGQSKRSGKPFIAVNCGAIPENLVESTLFGHEKGAFTGAVAKSVGKFREAEGGTLFLDEIGELSLDVQVKLLRALQEYEVEPVGASKPIKVNVRIISATHRDLDFEVKNKSFREDLFYRLRVFPVRMLPLRERWQDIPHLISHFIKRFSSIENKKIKNVTPQAMKLLQSHHWPGNVRELENAIFRAVVVSEDAALEIDDFLHEISDFLLTDTPSPSIDLPSIPEFPPIENIPPFSNKNIICLFDDEGIAKFIEDIEWEVIDAALARHDNNIGKAAKDLNIGQSTLYRRLGSRGISAS